MLRIGPIAAYKSVSLTYVVGRICAFHPNGGGSSLDWPRACVSETRSFLARKAVREQINRFSARKAPVDVGRVVFCGKIKVTHKKPIQNPYKSHTNPYFWKNQVFPNPYETRTKPIKKPYKPVHNLWVFPVRTRQLSTEKCGLHLPWIVPTEGCTYRLVRTNGIMHAVICLWHWQLPI